MDKLHNLRWEVLKEDMLVWCQPFHARQQPVPNHHLVHTERATHNAGQEICQRFNFGRLWWRALRQGLAMCCTSGPVISMNSHYSMTSKLTSLYDQRAHTTLRPVSSHHSMTSELTPLYDHELTPLYDQRARITLRPASSHHSTTSELTPLYDHKFTPLYDQRDHTTLRPVELTPLYDKQAHTTL
eukprot:Em0016g453a